MQHLGGWPAPGHELVDLGLGPAIDEAGQQISKVGLGIDVIQFAGLNQRSQPSPICRPLVATGKKAILS